MKPLRLGVIGLSEGNGHPYSWSAIFNGYDADAMATCPFPAIPRYLAERRFPDDAIGGATVTHVWTQERAVSEHVARCARIANVVDRMEDMIGEIDAVLLARDDAEHHEAMSAPFLEAGLPVYVDKPLAVRLADAERILAREKYVGQVFSCSALRYARELQLGADAREQIGTIRLIDATVPKSWAKYAVHVVEPALGLIPDRGPLARVIASGNGDVAVATVHWASGVQAVFKVLGAASCPLGLRVFGDRGHRELVFHDSFTAFRSALQVFLDDVRARTRTIPLAETLEVVEILDRGAPT